MKVIALTVFLFWPAMSIAASSDADMRTQLIGSWAVPKTSSDWIPPLGKSLEVYHPDGTEELDLYADQSCTSVAQRIQATWSIKDGVLITVSSEGETTKDEIIDISNSNMTLRSLDDGTTYNREKRETCAE